LAAAKGSPLNAAQICSFGVFRGLTFSSHHALHFTLSKLSCSN